MCVCVFVCLHVCVMLACVYACVWRGRVCVCKGTVGRCVAGNKTKVRSACSRAM